METEFWQKVEQVFHSALQLPLEARDRFLRQECAGQTGLMSEVDSLLRSYESHSGFLDEPVFDLGLKALADPAAKDLSGSTVGAYQIQERIGSGGMGEVYRAVDTRLNRVVALKFLSGSLENNKEARRQLVKEAQAVAMLDHPNICAVHNIEQTDESAFIVMQYIEGQTLADYIAEHQLDADEFKSVAKQIVSAVAFAHSHGVIHRDLKPGNIMLTPDGTIKVLDFGLAKIVPPPTLLGDGSSTDASHFSQAGAIIGTVAYMSPEQLRGEKLDYRSDIFGIGVVLYELVAGRNPFQRNTQAETIAAILGSSPPRLRELTPAVPPGFVEIVDRCLAKDKNDRFESAAEVLLELDNSSTPMHRQRSPYLLVGALGVSIVLIAWLATFFFSPSPVQRSVAVLPISFDEPLRDKEYLADGMTRSLIDNLSTLSNIKVKSEYLVARFKGATTDPQTVGRELGVDAVFTARMFGSPAEPKLSMVLVRVSDGAEIDSGDLTIDEANPVEIEKTLTGRIARRMRSEITDDERKILVRKDTQLAEAKQMYFRGLHLLERQQGSDDLRNAIEFFSRAKELDAAYAKAWTGLADTYALIGVPGHEGIMPPKEAARLARGAANQALKIDDTLAEAHVSLAMVKLRFDWDWDGAEAEFRRAIDLDPTLPPAHWGLSNLLIVKQRFGESISEAALTKDLAPFSPMPDLSLARTYCFQRNWIEMERVLDEGLKRFPDHKRLIYFRGLLYLWTGRPEEAKPIFEKLYGEDKLYAAAPLSLTYRALKRRSDVLKILEDLDTMSDRKEYVPAQERAWVQLALGNRDAALEYLNDACQEGFSPFPGTLLDPGMDELRSDPRFASLKSCAKLPAA